MRQSWLLLVGLLLLVACSPVRSGQEQAAAEVVEAFIGDLAATATASGKLLPQRTAALAASGAGRVAEVAVRVGDEVATGETLIQFETEALELTLASARQDLAAREANQLDLQTPAAAEEIAAAEAALTSAQAQLAALRAGPRPEEIASAEANLRAAEAGVWSSSGQLNQARNSVTEAQIASARANVAAAELALIQTQERNDAFANIDTHNAVLDAQERLENARAEVEALLAGPDPNAVGAAQADVGAAAAQRDARQANLDLLLQEASAARIAQAEAGVARAAATLARVQEGPATEDVKAAEAQVELARLAVADAEAKLAEATLRAPFDGVITAIYASEGELANGVVLEIIDRDSLRVVLTVDEADIGAVAVGQPAVITLEAWPETEIDSRIVEIGPTAIEGNSDLVSYEVYLMLADTELPVRAGMTASARLVTAQREDVLLVPNRAIIADRELGAFFVDLVVAGSGDGAQTAVERTEVSIGLRDGDHTQITSGLQEGDRVQIGRVQSDLPFGPPDE